MHHAVPHHTSTTSCALERGMPALGAALGDTHQHQPGATGPATDPASLRFDGTASRGNFVSFNRAAARGGAPGQPRRLAELPG